LKPLGLVEIPSLKAVIGMTKEFSVPKVKLPTEIQSELDKNVKTVILHPKSQGSAMEWPMKSYLSLADQLVEKGYTVFFTGTEKEGAQFRAELSENERIIDVTGKLTLTELISFISQVKNLVACSTGPLHIAGFTGIRTIGLFSPRKPIHPGRWQALGPKVSVLVNDPNCPVCKKKKACLCILEIPVEKVLAEIE
jgi:ADP-heptose:LPS heptosyltransferase